MAGTSPAMTGREEHGRTSPRRNRLSVLRINRPSSRHASARRLRRGGDDPAVRLLGLQPGRGQIRHPRHPADDAGHDPLGRRGADRCRLGQGARAKAARARRHARRRAHRRRCCSASNSCFLYQGLVYTTASRAVLFLYIAPFFVVIGSRIFLPADRFHWWQWAGLALSFSGLVLAFGCRRPPPIRARRSATC